MTSKGVNTVEEEHVSTSEVSAQSVYVTCAEKLIYSHHSLRLLHSPVPARLIRIHVEIIRFPIKLSKCWFILPWRHYAVHTDVVMNLSKFCVEVDTCRAFLRQNDRGGVFHRVNSPFLHAGVSYSINAVCTQYNSALSVLVRLLKV